MNAIIVNNSIIKNKNNIIIFSKKENIKENIFSLILENKKENIMKPSVSLSHEKKTIEEKNIKSKLGIKLEDENIYNIKEDIKYINNVLFNNLEEKEIKILIKTAKQYLIDEFDKYKFKNPENIETKLKDLISYYKDKINLKDIKIIDFKNFVQNNKNFSEVLNIINNMPNDKVLEKLFKLENDIEEKSVIKEMTTFEQFYLKKPMNKFSNNFENSFKMINHEYNNLKLNEKENETKLIETNKEQNIKESNKKEIVTNKKIINNIEKSKEFIFNDNLNNKEFEKTSFYIKEENNFNIKYLKKNISLEIINDNMNFNNFDLNNIKIKNINEERNIERNEIHLFKDIKINNINNITNHNNKETITNFVTNLKEQIENYKSPFLKINLKLEPENLGSLNISMIQRGNDLFIQMQSNNSSSLNFLTNNIFELRNQLNQNGINNFNLSFMFNGNNEHKNNKDLYRYVDKKNNHKNDNFETIEGLELILRNYA